MAVERVFGAESQIACVALEVAGRILQMALKCGRRGKLSIAGLALKMT